jgi:hypothetical protein
VEKRNIVLEGETLKNCSHYLVKID